MLNNFLLIAVTALAIFGFYKDRDAYKTKWRRRAVLCLTILIGIGGVVNNYYSGERAEKQHAEDQGKISELKSAVDTANKNQQDNTVQFVDAFGKLSQKVSDLQTQVKTAGLQKEATELRNQLEATQKALTQPKAILEFSFRRPNRTGLSIRKVTLPVKDNVVHVEFTLINNTDTPALDGEVTIMICDQCKFASESPSLRKLSGQRDTERYFPFERILAKTEIETLSADIQVPPNIGAFELGVNYRCRNCIIPEPKANTGTVFLDRSDQTKKQF